MQPVQVAPDIHYLRTVLVNVFFLGRPGQREWTLIDAGIGGHAGAIRRVAEELFGRGVAPESVVLTHGHFDHIGSLETLLREWDVRVYAHPLEFPYLTGRSAYPPPDPLVGKGSMSLMSRLFPRGPIDLGARLHRLPEDQSLRTLPGWRWLHTPGHSPGHVSLFRDYDRILLAGDAVTTVQQESALAVLTQKRKIHGPPAYFTIDWDQAGRSARLLALLQPEVLATSHGAPMHGEPMREGLQELSENFSLVARPKRGRYVHEPAVTDEEGIVSVPKDPLPGTAAWALAAAAVVAGGIGLYRRRSAAGYVR